MGNMGISLSNGSIPYSIYLRGTIRVVEGVGFKGFRIGFGELCKVPRRLYHTGIS